MILNYDDKWTKFFLSFKPKSQVYFVSLKNLPSKLKGAYLDKDNFCLRDESELKVMNIKKFKEIYGEHNIYNLLFSFLTSYLHLKKKYRDVARPYIIKVLKKEVFKLKTPEFRQQIIYKSKNLIILTILLELLLTQQLWQ